MKKTRSGSSWVTEKQNEEWQISETVEQKTSNSNRMAGTHIKSSEDVDFEKDLLQKSKTILELEKKLATSESRSASLEASTAQQLQQAKDHFSVLEAAFEKQRQVSEKLSATCKVLKKELQLKDEEIIEVKKVICLKTDALEHTCKAKEKLAAAMKEKEAEIKNLQELNQMLTEKQCSEQPNDDLFKDANHLSSLKSIDATKNFLQRRKMILELEEKVATLKRKASSLDLSSCQRLQQAKDNFSAGVKKLEDDVGFFKDSFKKTKKILVLEAAFAKQRQICERFSSRYESFMEHLEVLKSKINTLEINCNVKKEITAFINKNESELRNLCKLNRLLMEKLLPCSDQVPTRDLFEDRTQFTVHSPAMKTDKVVNPEGMKMSAGMSEAQKLIHVFKEKERAKKTDGPGLFPLPEFYTQPPPVENPYRERDFKLTKQNINIFKRLQQVEESKDIGSVNEFNLRSDMNLTRDIDLMHLQPIRRAYKVMMSLTEKSAIDAQIVQRAFEIYKLAHAKKMTNSYSILNVCCAALFIAYRESKSPRTFKEIAALGCISTRGLGRVFVALNREIDLNVEQVSVHDYLERFSAELNLPFIVKEAASHIVEKLLKMDLLLGCSQITVAASIIFIACYASPFRKTEQEIADACTVSQATIKNHVKKMLPVMKKLFPEDFPYKNMIPSLTVE